MSEGLNQVTLFGNLGADPELRFTQAGAAVLNIRLATTVSFLDKNKERQEITDWHTVTVWGKRGEGLAKVLGKGDRVLVIGSLRTSSYEGKDGEKRYKTEVVARDVFLGGRSNGGSGERSAGGGGRPPSGGGRQPVDDSQGYGDDSDIPF